jgi:hypothetical protein
MGAKIHLYPLERFTFGDEDYYDIDYYDGVIYQTAKIKGSTIKAGIIAGLPSVDTIYNADGTINSDRTITGTNSNQLLFDQFRKFVFNTNPAPFGTPGFEINGGITGPFLRVNNASTGDTMLQVSTAGIKINEAYTLPLNDGSAGQVMTTDGAGNVTFQNVPIITNWLPPNLQLFDALSSGGVTSSVNAGAGYHRYFNGTGSPGRLSFNVNLFSGGIPYNGQPITIKWQTQIFNSNSGGTVNWAVIYKFVTANGTTNAETGATTINAPIVVTGRTANILYEDTLATVSGPANSSLLMLSIVRTTGGNADLFDAIGIKLQ